jgi:hypothetical protein
MRRIWPSIILRTNRRGKAAVSGITAGWFPTRPAWSQGMRSVKMGVPRIASFHCRIHNDGVGSFIQGNWTLFVTAPIVRRTTRLFGWQGLPSLLLLPIPPFSQTIRHASRAALKMRRRDSVLQPINGSSVFQQVRTLFTARQHASKMRKAAITPSGVR